MQKGQKFFASFFQKSSACPTLDCLAVSGLAPRRVVLDDLLQPVDEQKPGGHADADHGGHGLQGMGASPDDACIDHFLPSPEAMSSMPEYATGWRESQFFYGVPGGILVTLLRPWLCAWL
jgi:hypothetical protein